MGLKASHMLAATGLNRSFLCLKQALGEEHRGDGVGSDFTAQHQALRWHQIKKFITLLSGGKEEITWGYIRGLT